MANTRKRKQKQTLKEFKAWLQGVEELQAEDWSPNCEQWQLIRAKIDGIIPEKPIVETVVHNQPPMYTPEPRPAPINMPFAPPPPTGGLPLADVDMTPAARAMLNPADGKIKTPDMDTSDGNVTSPFV